MTLPPGALVVSAQARADNPLYGPVFMAAMARAAVEGGAKAIRANGAADVAAIKAAVEVPVIGIAKRFDEGFPVYITPDFASARTVAEAGADIVALDATQRPRRGEPAEELIRLIKSVLKRPVFADIATRDEAERAVAAGADFIATTLSGYTNETRAKAGSGPDFALIEYLVKQLPVPIVAEGRFWNPDEVRKAFDLGAHAVVIGTAITNPREITRRFAVAAPEL